ncbi:MAG: serine/threonine-protein kinase, partial [Isosphaeraceae bacterium]
GAPAGVARVRQEFAAGSTDSPPVALLRSRQTAVATIGALVLLGGLAWLGWTTRGPLLALQTALVVASFSMPLMLSRGRPRSESSLRLLEVLLFATFALFLATVQYQAMGGGLAEDDSSRVLLAFKTAVVATVFLLFAHGLFIPNTWRSAARVVPLLAITPIATATVLCLTRAGAWEGVRQAVPTWQFVQDLTLLGLASGLAIHGAQVIQSLRIEARNAHELNHYRLVQRLGSGGMGEVYLAEHQLLKRPCAVKLIRHDSATDPIERTRFEREVLATARLSHPNTVEVYDYGRTDEGTFYYVMEYLRGLSLEEIVLRHGPMPAGRVIYLLRQVCGALAEAHAAGLVHRDVKPANIYASVRGGRHDVAKLLDFGLVKGPALGVTGEATDARRDGMIRGTPLYMAPEQVIAEAELDHRCDVYGLGGVAYRLLTGYPPFDRDSRTQVLSAHAHEPVLPPSLRRSDVPEDLELVILRCLDKCPDLRFQDAEALAEALAACQAAADWDAERAARWWQEHEPAAVAPMCPLS